MVSRVDITGRMTGWFATLRRDGRLFAALAVLLLVVQALQPLAAAAAMRGTGAFVICTSVGMQAQSDTDGTVRHEGCSSCIAGHCGHALPQAELDRQIVWWRPQPTRSAPAPKLADTPHPLREAAPPPGIRAPPFVA